MEIIKKNFIVGLDIGIDSVKIAQFANRESGLCLIKADLKEIKPSEDKAVREREVVSVLKDLFKKIDIKKSRIILTINCSKTAVSKVTAPYMPKAELGEGIKLEAKNYFPFPIDESLLDFEILGDIVEKGIRKYQLLVATSPRQTVDEYLSLLSKVGIRPSSLIPVPCALQKISRFFAPKENKTKCLVDIGERYTELVILKEENLVFQRKIPIAGRDFNKAMTGVLVSDRGKTQLSLEEIEKIKREVGIPLRGESRMINGKISTMQILSMLRPSLERLAGEIDRCFGYYREESGGGKIDSLILLGGGASLKGLSEFLGEELGIEVKLGSSPEGIKVEKAAVKNWNAISHRLALSIGAVLTEGRGINLLPPEIKEQTKRIFERAGVQAVTAAVILLLAFVYIAMKIQFVNFQKRVAVARMELVSLQPHLKEATVQNLTNRILSGEPHWEDVFKELSNIIPHYIYLTELSMKNKSIVMKGTIVSAAGEEILSDFMLALEKGIFKNVKLVTTKVVRQKSASEFELKCWVD